MSFDANVLSYFQELQVLKSLDEAEGRAFLDLLVLAVLADAEITQEELEQFDEELLRLPFLWDADTRERVVDHSAATREHLETIIGDDARVELFVRNLAETITSDEHRLIALRMFAAVVLTDGMSDLERERIFDVGSAFGLDSDVITDVVDDVRESLLGGGDDA